MESKKKSIMRTLIFYRICYVIAMIGVIIITVLTKQRLVVPVVKYPFSTAIPCLIAVAIINLILAVILRISLKDNKTVKDLYLIDTDDYKNQVARTADRISFLILLMLIVIGIIVFSFINFIVMLTLESVLIISLLLKFTTHLYYRLKYQKNHSN